MIRYLAFSVGVILCSNAVPCFAETAGRAIVSTAQMERYGLERLWSAQLDVDRSRGRLVQVTPYVNSTRATTYFEVTTATGKTVLSEKSIGRFGRLGTFGAVEQAAKKILREIEGLTTDESANVDEKVLAATESAAKTTLEKTLKFRETNESLAPDDRIDLDTLTSHVMKPLLDLSKANPDALPRMTRKVIPDITLFAVTDRALTIAIDGETGRTIWTSFAGHPNYPTLGPGVSDKYVAIVNGVTVYILDSANGDIVATQRFQGAAGAGPALSDEFVFIPMVKGAMVGFHMGDLIAGRFLSPKRFKCHGISTMQPLVVPGSVIWPTDRGHLYVANSDRQGVRYRLEAQDDIVTLPVAYFAENAIKLIVVSIDGYVYCLHERSGEVLWRFSAGQSMSETPIVHEEYAYVFTDRGSMFKISVETGEEVWRVQGIKKCIASSEERLYCVNRSGQILIVDPKSGGTMARMSTELADFKVFNTSTDRIYIGTKTGQLQCLREVQNEWPVLHAGDIAKGILARKKAQELKKKSSPEGAAEAEDDQDPFGLDFGADEEDPNDDPFAGIEDGEADENAADEAIDADEGNPFGGDDEDPFGTDEDAAEDDENPFG